jgi:hypothetical protein
MHWKSIVLFTAPALIVLGSGLTTAQDKTAGDPKRASDRLAIDQLTRDMVRAFERRDAAAVIVAEFGRLVDSRKKVIRSPA